MKLKKISIILLCIGLFSAIPFIENQAGNVMEYIAAHSEKSLESTDQSSSSQKVIVLDAGHGGYDAGSVSENEVYEKDITLAISLKLGEILTQAGYEIVYTRDSDDVSWKDDTKDDLRTRVRIAKEANADYYISIHTNASSAYNDGAYGLEIYTDNSNPTIDAMAKSIESNLVSLNYTTSRGIKSTDTRSLYVVDQNCVPAMLLEVGFLSDCDDSSYMASSTGQYNIASSIANGILEQL